MKNGTVIHDDPAMGYKIKFYYDELTDETTLKYVDYPAVVDKILDDNVAKQNMGDAFKIKTPKEAETDMWYAASIPAMVAMDWKLNRGINIHDPNHADAVNRLLNDIEYRKLRTGDFKL